MAIVEGTNRAAPERLFTVADVACLPASLPSGPVDYELRQGELFIMMSPMSDDHGAVQTRIASALFTQGDQRGHGTTRTETGVILKRNADTLYGPDVMFLAASRYPVRLSKEKYWESIPNIVVEVRSKNESKSKIAEKIRDYLDAGVEHVWYADPPRKIVTVHRPGAEPVELGLNDVLTADGIIPDFRLPIDDVFPR